MRKYGLSMKISSIFVEWFSVFGFKTFYLSILRRVKYANHVSFPDTHIHTHTEYNIIQTEYIFPEFLAKKFELK